MYELKYVFRNSSHELRNRARIRASETCGANFAAGLGMTNMGQRVGVGVLIDTPNRTFTVQRALVQAHNEPTQRTTSPVEHSKRASRGPRCGHMPL